MQTTQLLFGILQVGLQVSISYFYYLIVLDAVVINLGTNDYSTQPSPPQEIFETGYKDFIAQIQQQYSSQTPFFLVCGPLISKNLKDEQFSNFLKPTLAALMFKMSFPIYRMKGFQFIT